MPLGAEIHAWKFGKKDSRIGGLTVGLKKSLEITWRLVASPSMIERKRDHAACYA
jgi:hypothetical protein